MWKWGSINIWNIFGGGKPVYIATPMPDHGDICYLIRVIQLSHEPVIRLEDDRARDNHTGTCALLHLPMKDTLFPYGMDRRWGV